jgi:hypothetical protein
MRGLIVGDRRDDQMLSALTVAQALEIAEAAEAAHRDVDAMFDPLQTGEKHKLGRSYNPRNLEEARDIGAFASEDKQRVVALIAGLSEPARAELIAVVWFGREDSDDFHELVSEANETLERRGVRYAVNEALSVRRGLLRLGLVRD